MGSKKHKKHKSERKDKYDGKFHKVFIVNCMILDIMFFLRLAFLCKTLPYSIAHHSLAQNFVFIIFYKIFLFGLSFFCFIFLTCCGLCRAIIQFGTSRRA